MVKLLRKVAFWEATFFVVLCLAWVVTLTGYKLTGGLHTALVLVGFTHGCVFTAYLGLVLLVRARLRWGPFTTLSILIAGLIPGGGYVVEMKALHGARVDALAVSHSPRRPHAEQSPVIVTAVPGEVGQQK